MKLEIHIIQNFAPSNLNRDDTGSPKDCDFGGVRRARISSQCLKRAMRDQFALEESKPLAERLFNAVRTKRIIDEVIVPKLAKMGREQGRAQEVTTFALEAAPGSVAGFAFERGEDKDAPLKSEYLWFLSESFGGKFATWLGEHWDELEAVTPKIAQGKRTAPSKENKKKNRGKLPKERREELAALLESSGRTPEVGLFGRMIADAPEWNVDAACQVAHAISTHRVSMEFDFYTAIDDLKPEDTAGSDMMGTIPFDSACFYRYLVVDIDALSKNLGGDSAAVEESKKTVHALLRAAILAIPSGKQNSMAAHNPPSFILTDLREGAAPRSLANAFVDAVRPGRDGDLIEQSIVRMSEYLASLDAAYGNSGRKDLSYCVVHGNDLKATVKETLEPCKWNDGLGKPNAAASVDELVKHVTAAAFGEVA